MVTLLLHLIIIYYYSMGEGGYVGKDSGVGGRILGLGLCYRVVLYDDIV